MEVVFTSTKIILLNIFNTINFLKTGLIGEPLHIKVLIIMFIKYNFAKFLITLEIMGQGYT
jgi:hypothetical protein